MSLPAPFLLHLDVGTQPQGKRASSRAGLTQPGQTAASHARETGPGLIPGTGKEPLRVPSQSLP